MARVTGIGGVFFKASDPKKLAAWYRDNLGIPVEEWGGAALKWPDDHAEDRGSTAWMLAGRDSDWFSPSSSSFMINYRVDDLDGVLTKLRANGVEVQKGPSITRTARSPGSWIPTATSSSCGSRRTGTRRTSGADSGSGSGSVRSQVEVEVEVVSASESGGPHLHLHLRLETCTSTCS